MSTSVAALRKAFSHARDRWEIDNETLKGFYLESKSDILYCWEQAVGVLYRFDNITGDCLPIWTSAAPGENAEIWTVLPLPPTDAAAQQKNMADGVLSMAVEIPAGCFPGQQMQVVSPEGQEVKKILLCGEVEDDHSRQSTSFSSGGPEK